MFMIDNTGQTGCCEHPIRPNHNAMERAMATAVIAHNDEVCIPATGEVWNTVPATDGRYEASSLGQVRSTGLKGRTLRPALNGKYLTVGLSIQGRHKTESVHALVCAAFHGPRPQGMDCAHLNGKHLDNRPANLAWTTRKENIGHAIEQGVFARGSRHGNSVLTERAVLLARAAKKMGVGCRDISRALGVNEVTLHYAITGKSWAHVEFPNIEAAVELMLAADENTLRLIALQKWVREQQAISGEQ